MANGTDEQQMTRFRLAVDAVQHSLARHSVTLLIWDLDVDTPVNAGSATCIELRGARYLLTAAHVVQNSQGELVDPRAVGVVFRREGSRNNAFVQRILAVGGGREDPLDIALLELSAEGANEIATSKDFLPETRILNGVSADSARLFAVYGAPKSLSPISWSDETFVAGPMCYATISCDPFPSHLDQSHDIALEYNKTSNISTTQEGTIEAPDPKGLSGGGIWLITEPQDGVFWNPSESKLIGVQHTWLGRDGIVWGTQVQFGTSLLDEANPISNPETTTE
ncbi:hypothetical protein [Burkholderia ambifaria]|uniref:hypothetical protein n=1 Tax=Burkholderia ambifaria TaxID=152480 RepID=UPI00158C394E|nr:hypothetical protein [Burkholderia ambifaria]